MPSTVAIPRRVDLRQATGWKMYTVTSTAWGLDSYIMCPPTYWDKSKWIHWLVLGTDQTLTGKIIISKQIFFFYHFVIFLLQYIYLYLLVINKFTRTMFQFSPRRDRAQQASSAGWRRQHHLRHAVHSHLGLHDGSPLLPPRQPELHRRDWKLCDSYTCDRSLAACVRLCLDKTAHSTFISKLAYCLIHCNCIFRNLNCVSCLICVFHVTILYSSPACLYYILNLISVFSWWHIHVPDRVKEYLKKRTGTVSGSA